jgi:hypothetical protein
MEYVPPVPAGVPLRAPVAAVNVTPGGSAPVSLSVGVGLPVAVTVNVPAAPTVKVTLFALVIAPAWFTVSVKFWVASAPTPLCAVNVMEYAPPLFAAGIPLRLPVAALNVTPGGSVPVSLSVGAGVPVAVTVNVPAVPTRNVMPFALVIPGAGFPGLLLPLVVQPATKRRGIRTAIPRIR